MELELIFLWTSLVLYVAAGSAAIFGVVLRHRPERTILALLAAGLILHTLSIWLRWERLGHGPVITTFEILSSQVWGMILVFTLVYWRFRAVRPIAAVVMPVIFIIMGWLLMTDPARGYYPATYHTIWLYIHIGLGKVHLGALLVAVGLAGIILLRAANIGRERLARLPSDERLDDLAYRFMALAFIFATLMIVAGAIWAQSAWGRYWAWDSIETWAFVTWLTLAFALHLRFTLKTRPQVGAAMIMAVFVLSFLTFLGVPFISNAPHKGVM
jgi:ABC-type transport system involved in cytochrome c biogenesis permease subunit